MKLHKYLAFSLIALACGVTATCDDDDEGVGPTGPVVVVEVTPKEGAIPVTVAAGNVVELIATARDAQNRVVTTSFTWHSADETKATVNSLGVVDALSPGLVTISAETEGIRGGLPITVN